MGATGSIKKLKDIGYKTFDEFWDESYDNCNTYKERIERIIEILLSLKSKNFEELISIREQMKEITDYNFNNLNKFDGVFRHSQLTSAIDNSDPSILNTIVRPRMFQNITPSNNSDNNFSLSFVAPFFQSGDSTSFILKSTAFKINNVDHFFGDIPIAGSTNRTVIVYKVVDLQNITVVPEAGVIDVLKGTVTLNNFRPDDTTSIKITILPNSLDLAPKRDQLISIDNGSVVITPEIDTIAVAGSAGSITYSTTSRFKQ